MPSFSKPDVVLVRYPFSDLTGIKVRPAVVVHAPHTSQDLIVVPLTSRIGGLFVGEFVLADWRGAGLHVPTATKRGLFTVHPSLIVKRIGALNDVDIQQVEQSLRLWLGL
jgi:PemK-like, MazF-like toxin of type II toxin-antitoxin system